HVEAAGLVALDPILPAAWRHPQAVDEDDRVRRLRVGGGHVLSSLRGSSCGMAIIGRRRRAGGRTIAKPQDRNLVPRCGSWSRSLLMTWNAWIVASVVAMSAVAGAAVTKHGAPIADKTPAVKLATVLQKPAEFEGKTVVVEGKVRAACTRKGCWMELAPTVEKGTQGCRVTFKDY